MFLLLVALFLLLHSPQFKARELDNSFHSSIDATWTTTSNVDKTHDLLKGIEFVLPDESLPCPEQPLRAYLLSHDPLVVYIESFISDIESSHLIQRSKPKLYPAFVYQDGTNRVNQSARKSRTALLDRDHVVRCIEQRAKRIQEWTPGMFLERISIQHYDMDGFFTHHYDWFGRAPGPDRISTVNVFLQGNCTGGGTHFPYLTMPDDREWCRFLDCDASLSGVTFLPLAGNAVYWDNVRYNGSGYLEMLHAGMPVASGTKIGLNIWSWSAPEPRP
ncbi:hypothetical protein BDV12DRAFT_209272 [Aspergillus spectabilis]